MMLAAGRLDRRVAVQQRDAGQDAAGQPLQTWSTVLTCWAAIEPLSTREFFGSQAMQSDVTHRITVRHHQVFADPRAAAALRIVYQGRIFNLQVPHEIGRREGFRILASEALNDG